MNGTDLGFAIFLRNWWWAFGFIARIAADCRLAAWIDAAAQSFTAIVKACEVVLAHIGDLHLVSVISTVELRIKQYQ